MIARGTAAQYEEQQAALLPQGLAWRRRPGGLRAQIVAGIAVELARFDNRLADLVDEADPRTTGELLADWERVAGLPDSCTGALETVPLRREALVARLTARGGQSRAFFIALAASFGRTITIEELRPWDVEHSTVDEPLYGPEAQLVWRVLVSGYASTAFYFDVRDSGVDEPLVSYEIFDITRFDIELHTVDDPLASWGDRLLECLFERLKPAQTSVLFAYVE